jgi:collagen type I alpha
MQTADIAQMPCSQVTYYHLELSEHDVLLAECLPVESYLETGAVPNYIDWPMSVRLHADFSTRAWEAYGCAPPVVNGREVDAVRHLSETIAKRAAEGPPRRGRRRVISRIGRRALA